MKYLLDTDIASYYLRGRFNLIEVFREKGYSTIRLSRITVAQMEVLAYKNPHSAINLSAIQKLALQLGVLEPDPNTWRIFAIIKADALKQGKPVGDLDILQAAIAKQYNLIVITNNESHFQGLIGVENWAKKT